MAVTSFASNTPAASSAPQGVKFVRPELTDMLPIYDLVDDCIEGSAAIKAKGVSYLPMPDPWNISDENVARYSAYKTRALFYNATQRTVEGLQGQIFTRPPIVEIPTALDAVKTDSNGSGIGLEQLAKDACKKNIGKGRLGLFIDYPPRTAPASKAELLSGGIRPTIAIYDPKAIINWRYKTVGSESLPVLIVLVETYTVEDDGFETKTAVQYRELRLDENNEYFVQLWRASTPTGDDFKPFDPRVYPQLGNGKRLDFIPFTFVGSKNNEPSVDPAPMYHLAEVNIGHYRNSADYEESVYLVGQPMLIVSGLDQNWYKEILGSKIPFGSRNGLPLPKDAKAELIQAQPNTIAFEALEHKEKQMVALGAKLVQDKQVQRTAAEAGMENAAEEATLVNIAKNVSAAFQWALECCALFANVPETDIKFELNTDFEMARMSAEEINATVKTWQDGAISTTEMRSILRKAGRATQEDDEFKAEVKKDGEDEIKRAAKEIGATTKAVVDNTPPPPAK